MPCLSTPRALRLAIFTLLALFSLPLMPASAQDATEEPETHQITAAALLCNDQDCLDFGDRIDGFTISAVDINSGEVLDTCVTEAATETQSCLLEVPASAQWSLTYDESQTPAGYTFHGVIAGDGGAHGPISYLAFAPDAAEEPETYDIKVAGLLCLDRGCLDFGERIDDFTITAIDINTRETLGSCVTDTSSEFQGCLLNVPANSQWTLIHDEDETPEGYEYKGSIIGVEGGAHGSITYIPFIPLEQDPPQDDDDDDATPPVKVLPTTGATGPEASEPGNLGSVTLAVVTLMLAGAALHLRRR